MVRLTDFWSSSVLVIGTFRAAGASAAREGLLSVKMIAKTNSKERDRANMVNLLLSGCCPIGRVVPVSRFWVIGQGWFEKSSREKDVRIQRTMVALFVGKDRV
jgi:hypothetical protein